MSLAAHCLLVPALHALRGEGPAPHPVVLQPPAVLSATSLPGPPGGKGLYGGRLDNHVDSANFTVAWSNGDATTSAADLASEALEEAWAALVEEQGWPQPVSSDTFMIWVLLDPTLGGTGLTVPYETSEYPEGYPVIFLNPAYANNPSFFRSLAAHEFMHAIQFAMRDYYAGDEEVWYWEASAEWGAELALPAEDAYAYSSRWYSEQPELRYSSTEGAHQYGMFVLNAYIEEHLTGEGGLQTVWVEATGRDGEDWDVVLQDALGVEPADLWAGFTRSMAQGDLSEFSLYTEPARAGTLEDGSSGDLDYLGSHYYSVGEATGVRASGDVVLSGAEGWGDELELQAGDTLVVTGLAARGGRYSLELFEPDAGGDTGGPVGGDTGDGGDPLKPPGTTCDAGVTGLTSGWWFVLLLGLRRRRR